jgi:hypothetical protein
MMERLLRIGGIHLLLRSSSNVFWDIADRRYEGFFPSQDAEPQETIELMVVPDSALPASQMGTTSVRVSQDGKTVHMIRGQGIAEWDRQRHYCLIRQSEGDFRPERQHPEYVYDSVFRIVLSFLLLDADGLLLHSAGVIRSGKGYLFVGMSGAGKSTVARISAPSSTVLSDDLTLLYLTEGGGTVFGTPFFGQHSTGGANLSAPLEGMYFLHKAGENQMLPIAPGTALTRFLRSVMFFGQDRSSTDAILDLSKRLCARVPCYELHFLPDDSFWRCIDARSNPQPK